MAKLKAFPFNVPLRFVPSSLNEKSEIKWQLKNVVARDMCGQPARIVVKRKIYIQMMFLEKGRERN
jgi:hypothetical protein